MTSLKRCLQEIFLALVRCSFISRTLPIKGFRPDIVHRVMNDNCIDGD